MLKELYIKNIAVIDDLRLDFSQGFHIFTGETGAGKSILVESIGLVLGEKAKTEMIRDGAPDAMVEAVFDITDFPEVRKLLEREALTNSDDANEIVVKRQIQTDGKNKVFINHQRSSLSCLQEIANLLIDYTGQHQQIELLDARHDIDVLDSFVNDKSTFAEYHASFMRTKEVAQQIEDLKRVLLEKNERLDWIRYQLKELNELRIESSEQEQELKVHREHLKHMTAINQFSRMAGQVLTDGENSCVDGLNVLIREIEKKDFLQNLYGSQLRSLEDAKIVLEDIAYNIAKISARSEGVDIDMSADEIESQLFQLEKLKRKFGPELPDVLKKREELTAEKTLLENSDQNLADLKKKFDKEFTALKGKAEAVTKIRKDVSKQVEKAVLKELSELKMNGTQFVIEVKAGVADNFANYTSRGADVVTFLLSPNPGLALRPLAKIASGGETSRIFLAIKQVLTRFRQSGTLIFDEIDTGISGAAVELTGKKLKNLADRFQVFCITHHAQIASLADRHFLVSKEVNKGKTFTRVKILSQDERVQEVARLMGGVKISEKNLEYAREMVTKRK